MLDERNLKLDVLALALIALNIFLGLALATYDPADPPGTLVYPAHAHALNACGRGGAWVAHTLFESFGWAAWFVLGSLVVFDLRLLARRRVGDPWLRAGGWVVSLAGLATLCSMVLGRRSPGPAIGAGGYLGAAGRTWLQMHFANAGAYILAVSTFAAGLLLCTDYVLVQLAFEVTGRVGRLARSRMRLGGGDRDPALKPAKLKDDCQAGPPVVAEEPTIRILGKSISDDEADDALDAEEELATVPVRSKNSAAAAAAAAAEADDQDEEEESDEEEAAEAPPAAAATAVAVKPPAARKAAGRKGANDNREEVMQELDAAARAAEETPDYELPSIDLLLEGEEIHFAEQEKDVRRKAKILEKTFLDFGFKVKVKDIETGPVIAQFEIELEAGLRLSKITSLADDLAIALRVPSVRIVAPIPGKNTVGIEVPNSERQLVRIRDVIEEGNARNQKKMGIPLYLGQDVSGKPMVVDLASLPHLLIAGRTGTGKSVCLNSIIVSMLMTRRPDEVRMLMIDPKMVELSPYKTLPHLMHPVVTDMRKAEAILAWAVEKMEERYALLARAGVRHISGYNQLGEEELMDRLQPENDDERSQIPQYLPYIVIVADEIADMMMTAGKEVEQHIIRLAQKSRAVGIHLVLATQKPTVDVITGLIKSNLPARIAFQVASRTDSRVVLDEMGADKLLGNGDMLFLWPGTSTLLRGQGTYVSDDEINKIIDFVGTSEPQFVKELVQLKPPDAEGEKTGRLPNRDELYEAAVDLIVREGRGSVSLLQRGLGIGYGRAARLVDFMAEDGIVGQYNGSQAREVLLTVEQWEAMSDGGGGAAAGVPAATVKSTPAKSAPAKAAPATKQPTKEARRVERSPPEEEELDEEESDDDEEADDESDYLDDGDREDDEADADGETAEAEDEVEEEVDDEVDDDEFEEAEDESDLFAEEEETFEVDDEAEASEEDESEREDEADEPDEEEVAKVKDQTDEDDSPGPGGKLPPRRRKSA
ncbi:MAG TPA: DNA translocase FtsK [Pirellulales bacterium]|nr:DNA translocase FtsK [Pirellulales bacterium]